jgi:hypothetical protein
MRDTLPCIGAGARVTLPPNAWPIAWWPRQTPRIGVVSLAAPMRSRQIPASLGVQGPGDRTIASGRAASASSTPIASFRHTDTSAPSSPR